MFSYRKKNAEERTPNTFQDTVNFSNDLQHNICHFKRGQFHVFPGHIQTSILSKPVINCELRGSKFFNIPIMALTEINRTDPES